jgi:hypothetical protein
MITPFIMERQAMRQVLRENYRLPESTMNCKRHERWHKWNKKSSSIILDTHSMINDDEMNENLSDKMRRKQEVRKRVTEITRFIFISYFIALFFSRRWMRRERPHVCVHYRVILSMNGILFSSKREIFKL